jgi:hypothetical protein
VSNRLTGAGDALPPSEGATDAGADEDAVGVDGDGLAAVPHAANTIIAPANKPTRLFRINTPPTECVSPHCWSQSLGRFRRVLQSP